MLATHSYIIYIEDRDKEGPKIPETWQRFCIRFWPGFIVLSEHDATPKVIAFPRKMHPGGAGLHRFMHSECASWLSSWYLLFQSKDEFGPIVN